MLYDIISADQLTAVNGNTYVKFTIEPQDLFQSQGVLSSWIIWGNEHWCERAVLAFNEGKLTTMDIRPETREVPPYRLMRGNVLSDRVATRFTIYVRYYNDQPADDVEAKFAYEWARAIDEERVVLEETMRDAEPDPQVVDRDF